MSSPALPVLAAATLVVYLAPTFASGESFRVASYNVEGYLEASVPGRPAKSAESKAQIRESIRALKPDVLALQEIGNLAALLELQASLKAEGLDLPQWDFVSGSDTNIHVAVLSRFEFIARHPYTNLSFLLGTRRHHVSRGFSETELRVNTNYSFTLIAAHLKSRRSVPQAEESELRLEEAKLLRGIIDLHLKTNPEGNLVVLGDLNDTRDSAPIKAIIGRGKTKLLDTRPTEREVQPNSQPPQRSELRTVSWTHYFSKEDTYSRIDYILLSPGMAREWSASGTFVLAQPNWGMGSDHRPVVAEFIADDQ